MLSPSKSRRAVAALLLCSLALLGCASVATASTGSSSSSSSSSAAAAAPSCACSDVRPRSGSSDFSLGPTCSEIAAKGNCNEGYMQKTIAEMKGAPYCQVRAREKERTSTPPPPGSPFLDSFFSTTTKKKQISCGQCKCCQPLGLALKSLGLSALADALAAADPQLGAALKNPATEVTLLAPAGFKAGGTPLDAAAARRHVLPAMNGTGALWTRELLLGAGGGQVESAERGAPVLVKGATLTSGGGGKTATIVDAQSNIEACKSLIHVIDGVL